jgi:hypothetical protein
MDFSSITDAAEKQFNLPPGLLTAMIGKEVWKCARRIQ